MLLNIARSFLTHRSTSQMQRGEKFSQHAVPVTKELHTERQNMSLNKVNKHVLTQENKVGIYPK